MSTKTWPFNSVMPILIRGSDGIARKAFVMTALTTKQRSSGMMGLKDWNSSDGMLFIHPRGESEGYWMKDTVLPMTISFFNQDGKFMYQKDAQPLDTTQIKPGGVFFYVLETPIKSAEYFKIGPRCSLIRGMQKSASDLEHTLITGVPGSGKTTKAYELSKDTGMPVIQLDKVFAKTPEWKFNEDVAKRIRDLIAKLDTPTIIEGTQLMTLSKKDLTGHKVIVLEAMKLELLKRLLKRGWYDNDGKLWRNPIESNKMLNEFKPMVEEFRERANLSKQAQALPRLHYTPTSAIDALTRANENNITRSIPENVGSLPAASLDSLRRIFSGVMDAPSISSSETYGLLDDRPEALQNLMTLRDSVAKNFYPDSIDAYRHGGGRAGMSNPLAYARYTSFMDHPASSTDIAWDHSSTDGLGLRYPQVSELLETLKNDPDLSDIRSDPSRLRRVREVLVERYSNGPGSRYGTSRNNDLATQMARMWTADAIGRHEATEFSQRNNRMNIPRSTHANPTVGLADLQAYNTAPTMVREALGPYRSLRLETNNYQPEITGTMLRALRGVGRLPFGLNTSDLVKNPTWNNITRLQDAIDSWNDDPDIARDDNRVPRRYLVRPNLSKQSNLSPYGLDLSKYISMYDTFDEAHSRQHMEAVLRNALKLADKYAKNKKDLTSAAAILHDIGISKSRERHEDEGARIVSEDNDIKKALGSNLMKELVEAIAEHRATTGNPHGLVGKIISDADRTAVSTSGEALDRAMKFRARYNPEMEEREALLDSIRHLADKYAKDGPGRRTYFKETDESLSSIYDPIISMSETGDIGAAMDAIRSIGLSKQSSVIDDATNLLGSLRRSVVRRLGGISPRIDAGGLVNRNGPISVGARFPAWGHEGDVSLRYRPHNGSYNIGLGYSGDNWDLGGEFGNDHGPHWGVHGEIRW